jgi:hypothetical protein
MTSMGVPRAALEIGVIMSADIQQKYYAFFDDEVGGMRLASGFALGIYPDRDAALRAAKARGWKLEPGVSRHPDPPAASAETG